MKASVSRIRKRNRGEGSRQADETVRTMPTTMDLIGPKMFDPGKRPIVIVESDYLEVLDEKAAEYPRPWAEILAAGYLQAYLLCNYHKTPVARVKPADLSPDICSSSNLICLCSPAANSFVAKIFEEWKSFADRRFDFVLQPGDASGRRLPIIRDLVGALDYESVSESENTRKRISYGLIMKRPSDWNEQCYVIVIAGDNVRGTQGAVASCRNAMVNRLLSERESLSRFDMLVRCFSGARMDPAVWGDYVFPRYLSEQSFTNPAMTQIIPALIRTPRVFDRAKAIGALLVALSGAWLILASRTDGNIVLPLIALVTSGIVYIISWVFKCIWIRCLAAL